MGDLVVFVGQVRSLSSAHARMAAYDPEGIFDLRVVDNETEEIVPDPLIADIVELQTLLGRPRRARTKVNWTKEGF